MEDGFIRIREDTVEVVKCEYENGRIELHAVTPDWNKTLIVRETDLVEWVIIHSPPPGSYALPRVEKKTYNLQFGIPPGFEELAEFLRIKQQEATK